MGTFVLTTGEDILTRFEITEGKIESAVEGLRKDFTEDRTTWTMRRSATA